MSSFFTTIYLARRGFKGLREKKMIADQEGDFATGKDAVSVAGIYLFFAALCFICTIMFFICAVALITHHQ
jgi:hypothetical protein